MFRTALCGILIFSNLTLIVFSQTLCENSKCSCVQETDTPGIIVTYIDCSLKNFKDMPNNETLPYLAASLDFSRNNIRMLNNSNYSLYSESIKKMDLSKNKLESISNDFLKLFPNLIELDLSYNELRVISNELFMRVNKIQSLNLNFNKIKVLPNKIFNPLPELNILLLRNNSVGECLTSGVSVFGTEGLSLTPKIKILNLQSTNITKLPYQVLEDASQLSELYLSDNPLSEFPDIPSKVEILDISGTNINVLSPKKLRSRFLKTLVMKRMHNLTKLEDYAFMNLASIKSISLDDSYFLQNFNPLSFGANNLLNDSRNHPLKSLSLARCGLKELSESFANFFKKMDYINLDGNLWQCDCHLDWIKDLKIFRDNNSEYLRCNSPVRYKNTPLARLRKTPFVCESTNSNVGLVYEVLVVILLALIVTLIALTVYLIMLGPYSKNKSQYEGQVGPSSPYRRITISPNDAEIVYFSK